MKTFISVFILTVWFCGMFGYGLSCYKFVTSDFEAPYKREVIQGIGVVTGLGCITGYLDLGE